MCGDQSCVTGHGGQEEEQGDEARNASLEDATDGFLCLCGYPFSLVRIFPLSLPHTVDLVYCFFSSHRGSFCFSAIVPIKKIGCLGDVI